MTQTPCCQMVLLEPACPWCQCRSLLVWPSTSPQRPSPSSLPCPREATELLLNFVLFQWVLRGVPRSPSEQRRGTLLCVDTLEVVCSATGPGSLVFRQSWWRVPREPERGAASPQRGHRPGSWAPALGHRDMGSGSRGRRRGARAAPRWPFPQTLPDQTLQEQGGGLRSQ